MVSQLTILAESLDKKLQVLERIQEYNRKQEAAFVEGQVTLEDFDEAVEQKGRLIEELTRLDEGFEIMYARLAEELQENRSRYAEQIRILQQKITVITDMSMSIQAQEKRNKQLVEQYFSRERTKLGESRKTSKAAFDYYRNMSNTAYVEPQMYDNKK